jgi:hypothetical protein
MPPRIRQGRFANTTEQGRPLPSIDRFASHDRTAGGGPIRRPRQTHQERGQWMTRPSQRASSERQTPHRSEPATAPTAIHPTREITLSIPTLRLHCPMFHRKEISEYRGGTRATMASLARYERQGQAGDSASSRPIGIAFPNGRSRDRKGPGVAIGPVAAPLTTAIFNTTPFRGQGRGRDAADRTR